MDAKSAVEELEGLAEKLGVKVTYEKISGEGMGPGGLCKVKGKWRAILDSRTAASERAAILAQALCRFEALEQLYVSPSLRAMMDRFRQDGDQGRCSK